MQHPPADENNTHNTSTHKVQYLLTCPASAQQSRRTHLQHPSRHMPTHPLLLYHPMLLTIPCCCNIAIITNLVELTVASDTCCTAPLERIHPHQSTG
jgi:hypothetical protein